MNLNSLQKSELTPVPLVLHMDSTAQVLKSLYFYSSDRDWERTAKLATKELEGCEEKIQINHLNICK